MGVHGHGSTSRHREGSSLRGLEGWNEEPRLAINESWEYQACFAKPSNNARRPLTPRHLPVPTALGPSSSHTQSAHVVPRPLRRPSRRLFPNCLPLRSSHPGVIPPPLPLCDGQGKPAGPHPRPSPVTTLPCLSSRSSLHPPALGPSLTPLGTHCEYIGKSKSPWEPAHSPKKSKSAVIVL